MYGPDTPPAETQLGRRLRRAAAALFVACAGAALCACSGTSSGAGGSSSSSSGLKPSSGISGGAAAAVNVASIIVDAGPTVANCTSADTSAGCAAGSTIPTMNSAFLTVKICAPGSTTNCVTLDHVSVDTGSSGFRLPANAVSSGFLAQLPQITSGSQFLAECVQFGSGYTWGSVRTVDLYIPTTASSTSYEKAASVNIQVTGDLSAAPLTTSSGSCTSGLASMNTVYSMGGNALLGVGLFINDCVTGGICPANSGPPYYALCSGSSCSPAAATASQQVFNPASVMVGSDGTHDSGGVIVELPAFPSANFATGASTVTGSLVFGINTRSSNNALTTQTVITAGSTSALNPGNAIVELVSPTTYGGTGAQAYSEFSFLDSGSNGIFLPDVAIPCNANDSGWFTPSSLLTYSATIQGMVTPGTTPKNIQFSIADSDSLFTYNSYAFNDLAGPSGSCVNGLGSGGGTAGPNGGIDLGLPFFYGLNVYVGLEGISQQNSSSQIFTGPFWAF